jgi:hypothetical protein
MRLFKVEMAVTYRAFVVCEDREEVDEFFDTMIDEVNECDRDVVDVDEVHHEQDIDRKDGWRIPYGENSNELPVSTVAEKLFGGPVEFKVSVPKSREDEIRRLLKDAGVEVE